MNLNRRSPNSLHCCSKLRTADEEFSVSKMRVVRGSRRRQINLVDSLAGIFILFHMLITATIIQVVAQQLAPNPDLVSGQPIQDSIFMKQSNNSSVNSTKDNSNATSNSRIMPNHRNQARQHHQQNQVIQSSHQNNTLVAVRQRWRLLERSIADSMGATSVHLRQMIENLNQKTAPNSVSNQCKSALNQFIDGLAEQRLWASQMMDASARMPSGMLEGTLTELGNFDECLSIRQHPEGGMRDSRGQYCSLIIKPPLVARPRLHTVCQRLPALSANQSSRALRSLSSQAHQFFYVGLRLGICTPSKCSTNDIQQLLSMHLSKYELTGQVKSCQVAPMDDQQSQKLWSPFNLNLQQYDLTQQCILLAFLVLILLTVFGTLLDKTTLGTQAAAEQTGAAITTKPSRLRGESHDASHSQATTAKNHLHLNQPRLSTGSSGCDSSPSSEEGCGTMESMTPGSAVLPNVKRWHYQVYRGGGSRNANATSDSSPDHLVGDPLVGPQRNPLSEFDVKSGSAPLGVGEISTVKGECPLLKSRPSRCELHRNLQQTAAPLLSELGEKATTTQATSGIDALTSDESWLAQMEDEEHELDLVGGKNHPGKEPERQVNWLIALICCFSLKKNLRMIGKHHRSPESSSNASSETNVMGDIKVIHGLRTLTMVWIIFGHSIGLVSPEMMNNLFSLAHLSCSSRLLQAILNATLAVNTFFMISGLVTVISLARKCGSVLTLILGPNQTCLCKRRVPNLITGLSQADGDCSNCKGKISANYWRHKNTCRTSNDLEISSLDSSSAISSLSSSASSNKCIGGRRSVGANQCCKSKKLSEKSKPQDEQPLPSDYQPFLWLLMRYLRLTPAYAAIIGVSLLLPALGSGPFWQETINPMGSSCKQNWWLNLLYLNNFINTDKLCLIHSWYLSNDWQFFILTLLLLGLFYKSRGMALLAVILMLAASSAATFKFTIDGDFPPTIVTTSPAVAERWLFIHSLYYKPWPHLPSYLVGILAGYVIVARERIGQMSGAWRFFCWLLCVSISCALLNSIYPWNMGIPIDPLLTGLHSATFRTLWAACCAWFVYALVIRPDNLIARVLSWHGFQITSRLTYCAYLVHPLIIYYHFGSLRERMDSSPYGQLYRFSATLALSYLFALLLSVLVESPSIQIQHFMANFEPSKKISESTRRGKKQTISLSSGNPWTVTSSFGDQTSTDSLINGPTTETRRYAHESVPTARTDNQDFTIKTCCLHNGLRSGGSKYQPNIAEQVSAQSENSVAQDVEFQRKLAQAIGRGFRLRSRMA